MSNYTPIVDYAAKDALSTGNPAKLIKGVEVSAEFDAIETAITSKEDTSNKGIANGYAPLNASILLADAYLTTNIPRLDASNTFTNNLTIFSSVNPTIRFNETDGAADNKRWLFEIQAEQLLGRVQNDAGTVSTTYLTIDRTGTTVDSIAFTATGFTFTGVLTTSAGVELGHASDTTLSRGGAGILHVEGHPVATTDQSQTISAVYNFTAQPTLSGEAIGFREVPQNPQAGNYTCVLSDNGKHIYHGSADGAGDTYTIPANASVAYPLGTVLTFINSSASTVAIAITSDTLTLAGSTSTGTRTLAQNGVATAIKVTTTSWLISGTGLT